jgi:hypothetical protein
MSTMKFKFIRNHTNNEAEIYRQQKNRSLQVVSRNLHDCLHDPNLNSTTNLAQDQLRNLKPQSQRNSSSKKELCATSQPNSRNETILISQVKNRENV